MRHKPHPQMKILTLIGYNLVTRMNRIDKSFGSWFRLRIHELNTSNESNEDRLNPVPTGVSLLLKVCEAVDRFRYLL